jgi:hypothetical protein
MSFNATSRSGQSDDKIYSNVTTNDLEAQGKGTGSEHHFVDSTTTLIHRDALGRIRQVPQEKWSPHGWYLDPDNAKLAELEKVQGTQNMHSKLPWVIQMAASSYVSDGKGVLSRRSGQYALACLALPWLVSRS